MRAIPLFGSRDSIGDIFETFCLMYAGFQGRIHNLSIILAFCFRRWVNVLKRNESLANVDLKHVDVSNSNRLKMRQN